MQAFVFASITVFLSFYFCQICVGYRHHDISFEPVLARRMLNFAAIAYTDSKDVPSCLQSLEDGNFHLIGDVSVSCSWETGCYAFTAISHKDKVIVVSVRGSYSKYQILVEVLRELGSPSDPFSSGGLVYRYFSHALELMWPALSSQVEQALNAYPSYQVWVTGHSLGAAVASLLSAKLRDFDIVTSGDQLLLIGFGMPRVGNSDYALGHDALVTRSFRVVHFKDIVSHVPPCTGLPNKMGCRTGAQYAYHHGLEIFYPKENMTIESNYTACHGLPQNEDNNCSNSLVPILNIYEGIHDHTHYFNFDVSLQFNNCTKVDVKDWLKTNRTPKQPYLKKEKEPEVTISHIWIRDHVGLIRLFKVKVRNFGLV